VAKLKLKQLIQRSELSQKQIAEKLGIKETTFSQYVVGNNEPSIDNLIQFADFFNVSLDFLCGRYEETESVYREENEQDILRILNKFKPLDQAKLIDRFETLAANYRQETLKKTKEEISEELTTTATQ